MTVLTTDVRQPISYRPSLIYNFLGLVGVVRELAGWYRSWMDLRALEGMSIMDLKDIGYPTARQDESSIRTHRAEKRPR